jgi:hypothetical protein
MKKLIIILTIFSFILSCSSSKQVKKEKPKLGKISNYERLGSIENKNILDSLLSATTNKKIDSTKPLVIIYYPGKDKCNSGGTATRSSIRDWYNEMENGINKISKSNIIYIYKDNTGLFGKNDGYQKWYEDPENTIEQLFFEEHPPCSGYVLLSKTGEYFCRGAEFSKESLWQKF